MFCDACGNSVNPGDGFCGRCGKAVVGPVGVWAARQPCAVPFTVARNSVASGLGIQHDWRHFSLYSC
jgi:hypothetical protein